MFTGLIQTTGTIRTITPELIQIAWSSSAPSSFLQGIEIGDSIAVNGICLTVTQILSDSFWAAVSPETLDRTILGQSRPQDTVNLESSLRVGSKIGGHFVTGHIDGVGYFQSAVQTANSWEMQFTVTSPRVARYIVPKGSIAVNGISLTVADCDQAGSWFMVAVIPLTYEETNLKHLKADSPVNLEGDVLGKYVEKFLHIDHSEASSNHTHALESFNSMTETGANAQIGAMYGETATDITAEYLSEHGYG
ncbi:MAG: riboflavin synthase [Cyanobacteria bacterium P01_F01_bin.150]